MHPQNSRAGSGDRIASAQWLPDGDIRVGVIGQGIVGAMTAQIVSSAGIPVVGYDRDEGRVASLVAQAKDDPRWSVVGDPCQLADADVIVIAVRISAASDRPDLTAIEDACRRVFEFPRKNRLVIIETTLPPGTTRRLSAKFLNPADDGRTLVAYCPERLREGDSPSEIRLTPRLVGGLTPEATLSACFFLDRIGIKGVPVTGPEVAELSKLLENTFLTTGIALMGELTRIAHAVGISATEVAHAASTKPRGYHAFWPGAGIGGHCLINDMRILEKTASELQISSPVISALGDSCEQMTPEIVSYLEELMDYRGKALGNSRIWLIGIGFKVGSADISETPATDLIRTLRANGADVVYSDSLVGEFDVDELPVERIGSGSWPADAAAALILSGDPAIDLSELQSRVPVVLDLGGARIMPGSEDGISRL